MSRLSILSFQMLTGFPQTFPDIKRSYLGLPLTRQGWFAKHANFLNGLEGAKRRQGLPLSVPLSWELMYLHKVMDVKRTNLHNCFIIRLNQAMMLDV